MNTFGQALRVTTFGESHGVGIGGVIDGLPAGIPMDMDFIYKEMQRRAGGQNLYSTQRKEADRVEILSGVFEGKTTGTPLGFFIQNSANKSKDYDSIKNLFRPGHADFTYFQKYGVRDYRGGGRSSARESAVRVAAGAIAKLLLSHFNIKIQSGILSIGKILGKDIDFKNAQKSEIFALDKNVESQQKEAINNARNAHNSIGGVALVRASGIPAGLGEPLYYKLDSAIGALMLGLNGVKAVEIGEGTESTHLLGSENNDQMDKKGFQSNHCGGILGGISTGNEILIKVHFKPTPSIFLPQYTQDINGNVLECNIKGRHDPCIAVRGSVVCEAQLALILADMLLLNATSKLEYLQKIYASKK
ncbi:chorismate synthase [Helicobacter turcicus]|uniref:Chorismate synthase n=1 Tax=Helicobacter turcicus TaxID=2867412 RepID=A0ABS7JL17_9HELI|nr:chorismate synthase [Helicobacter turcicus]MBX7490089.1 chorismate synthase [Helicobacter turcicus]MBX7544948.1 chorismate synthase [Helicobacter turcicus]